MKHLKKFKLFKYLIHEDDVVEIVNKKRPISLKYNGDLIDRIHNRYPFLTKYEIAVIVKTCFHLMRELLIKNKILYLSSFISQFFILFSKKNNNGKDYVSLKVAATTPSKVRDVDEKI